MFRCEGPGGLLGPLQRRSLTESNQLDVEELNTVVCIQRKGLEYDPQDRDLDLEG